MFPGRFQVRKFKQERQQKIFSVVSTAVLPFPTSTSTSATASAPPPRRSTHNSQVIQRYPPNASIEDQTMQFEHISDADSRSHADLTDPGVPVVFGALTAVRGPSSALAGIGKGSGKDHNDGDDWGLPA